MVRRLAKARPGFDSWSCEVCGGQSGTGTGFSDHLGLLCQPLLRQRWSKAGTIGPLVAAVWRGFSVIPSHELIKKGWRRNELGGLGMKLWGCNWGTNPTFKCTAWEDYENPHSGYGVSGMRSEPMPPEYMKQDGHQQHLHIIMSLSTIFYAVLFLTVGS
jgi:hypothetical protein